MPVFGEKFLLPVLATVITAVVLLNPMKWDWQSRVALFVGVTALAFLLSHQIHLRNETIRLGATPPKYPDLAAPIKQDAHDCAQNVLGSGNNLEQKCGDKETK